MNYNKSFNKFLISAFAIGIVVGSYGTFIFYSRNTFHANDIITIFDRNYFPTVDKLIKNANNTIYVAMFEIKYYKDYPNSLENKLVEDLIDAKNRGVTVYVIADEYSKGEKDVINLLKENGINAKLDSKNVTTHDKLLIIDGKITVVGSTNWSHYAIEKNHEVSVVIFSKDVAKRFEDYFWKIWNES